MLWFVNYLMASCESEVTHSRTALCDPMDCSLLGASVHGIFRVRMMEWVVAFFSRASSQPRDRTQVSCVVGWLYPLSHQGIPVASRGYVFKFIMKYFTYTLIHL